MTGIVLCEISSGLSISPSRIPDGVVGDSTPVTFIANGATGQVHWASAPPGESGLPPPPGRTLTDNGDGTATMSGTYSVEFWTGVSLYCWDAAGQVASLSSIVRVQFAQPLQVVAVPGAPPRFNLAGGPFVGAVTVQWVFEPALPPGWTVDQFTDHCVVHITTGTWTGTISCFYKQTASGPNYMLVYPPLQTTLPSQTS